MIPPSVAAAFQILDALGARNAAALERLEARRGWLARLRGESAARRALREAEGGWLARAIAPWREEGGTPRTVQVRERGAAALARFAELDGEDVAVVELTCHEGPWRFRDVRRVPEREYGEFGDVAQ